MSETLSELLAGKVAFISGRSRGIGEATALKMAGAGCDMAIRYYNSHEESEAVCESIRAVGRKALAVQTDVSNPDSVGEAFEEFKERIPLGPTLSPEQVADAVYLPCLPESAMVAGHTLFVDGGYAISG